MQACQGRKRDSGTALENVPIVIAGKQNPENLPTTPDFFVARSSYQGLVSYRDEGSGSFFIQILAEKLKKGMDLHSALTLVMDHIARKLSFDEGFKQMPTIVSTLSDTFKF